VERRPVRILSGGQSGVDRAALDVAIELGLSYGGWCPRGGWAEDLPEPPGVLAAYPGLVPTPSEDPAQRTRWNVRDSAATLILAAGQVASAGTALALASAMELGRPLAVLDPAAPGAALGDARELLADLDAEAALNIAGPRESEAPGIYARSVALLSSLLQEL
jgi:Circularly permutated YpsA SLOG family